MRVRLRSLTLWVVAAVLIGAFAAPALADSVVYTNGSINGTITAFTINMGYQVSNSFIVSSSTTLSQITFGVWNLPGDTTNSVGWAILTYDPFESGFCPCSSVPLTTATVSSSPNSPSTNEFGYDLNLDTFSLSGVTLAPGGYYLVLGNASTPDGDQIYWDANNGPSYASGNSVGGLLDYETGCTTCSEAFTIYGGPPTVTPEPGTLLLLGTGAAVAFFRRRLLHS